MLDMTTCSEVQTHLQRFCQHTLDETTHRSVALHIESCAECSALLDEALFAAVEGEELPPLPPDIATNVDALARAWSEAQQPSPARLVSLGKVVDDALAGAAAFVERFGRSLVLAAGAADAAAYHIIAGGGGSLLAGERDAGEQALSVPLCDGGLVPTGTTASVVERSVPQVTLMGRLAARYTTPHEDLVGKHLVLVLELPELEPLILSAPFRADPDGLDPEAEIIEERLPWEQANGELRLAGIPRHLFVVEQPPR